LPHDLVHVLQALKAPGTQSFGHTCTLQVLASRLCGQATPPKRGDVLVRLRVCLPEPHDLVHVLQAVQLPTPQSCGQACVLHGRVSV
jgi:hypothetical protein